MSFSGDLEYLSIVDVIQLMHTTRKSGALRINGRRGEISLSFNDGYIIGAIHYQQGARVGNILMEAGEITRETLDNALKLQEEAGNDRKPLIATMLENGLVDKDAAYRGLEALIEAIIVEILTWKKGKFELDPEGFRVCDEFKYFPDNLNEQVALPTEHLLMDALRIYDEKIRDGLITNEEILPEDILPEPETPESDGIISADDLGLGDLGAIKRKIPGVYEGLKENRISAHHKKIAELSPKLGDLALVEIAALLDHLPPRHGDIESTPLPLIFYSEDRFIIYCVTTACSHAGLSVFTSSEPEDISAMAGQYLSKKQPPVMLMDIADENNPAFTSVKIDELRRELRKQHPDLCIIQLSSPHDYNFWLETFQSGFRIVIPRPAVDSEETFIKDLKKFLTILPPLLTSFRETQEEPQPIAVTPGKPDAEIPANEIISSSLLQANETLHTLTSVPEAAMALLKLVSAIFNRCLTLVVREEELIAERGIGITSRREDGPGKLLGFKIPAEEGSIFRFMLDKGYIFYGKSEDRILQAYLHRSIGTPLHSTILLLPLKLGKKIVSITYADFGQSEVSEVSTEMLETFASQASIALENTMNRNRIEETAA